MSIDLTEEQKNAIRTGKPVRIHATDAGGEVVVLRAAEFENLCEELEDQRLQQAFRAAGLRSAVKRLKEDVDEDGTR
jgi:PHD/YefM family antitoxin component YafN of YafNO toxin-antitoxin module